MAAEQTDVSLVGTSAGLAQANAVERAADLTAAWLGNPNTKASLDDVANFLTKIHAAIEGLVGKAAPEAQAASDGPEFVPAVSVRKSLASKDHIISMIDGKPYKLLRRHLSTHRLTPDQYRERYGLKPDYPMVAETYAESRRALAKKLGLGRKPAPAVEPEPTPARKKRRTLKIAAPATS